MNLSIRTAGAAEANKINALYRRCGYSGNVAPKDIVLLAELDGEPVGAVRICEEDGTNVLRGMYLLPAYHRKGIGSKLLQHGESIMPAGDCFCLPYAHLVGFYQQIGFLKIEEKELPRMLQARLASYRSKGLNVIAMRRLSNHSLDRPAARCGGNLIIEPPTKGRALEPIPKPDRGCDGVLG